MTQKEYAILIGISLITFIVFLDVTIVSTALPAIQHEFAASVSQLQWILNALFLTLSALMATVGRIGDLLGRRRIVYIGAGIFFIASLGAGLATSMNWLIFFRFLQGIAGACIPVAAALLANHFPANRQSHVLALFATINGCGLALGPLIGGFLVQTAGWRWIFLINVPVIIVSLILCAYAVREQKTNDPDEKFDIPAALSMIIGISAFIVTLSEGPVWGWGSKWAIFSGILAFVSLSVFFVINGRSTHPVIDFAIFRKRFVIASALCCFSIGAIISVLLFLDPIYLQSMLGQSAEYSGIVMLAISGTFMAASLFTGKFVHHFGVKAGLYTMLLLCIATAFLHHLFLLSSPLWLIGLAFVTFGIPWSLGNVAPTLAAVSSVDNKHAAVTLGCIWTVWNLGSSIALAINSFLLRFKGEAVLSKTLREQHIVISESQLEQISHYISDPEIANRLLSQFSGLSEAAVTPILKATFMQGFHLSLQFLIVLSVILTFIIFLILRNTEEVKVANDRTTEF